MTTTSEGISHLAEKGPGQVENSESHAGSGGEFLQIQQVPTTHLAAGTL